MRGSSISRDSICARSLATRGGGSGCAGGGRARTSLLTAGASFEGFVIEQLFSAFETSNACFWATHGGAEPDLLVTRGGKRYGFECELVDAPGTTRSMRVAIDDLGLEHLWVV